MCKVSVIVPVYNVERYLRSCMNSLVAQTLKDIEIIAVNDGSPDNSLAILEEYEEKYSPMVKVFSTKNQGVSHARNFGADRASGEYLAFVDSDDYVEPDYCEAMYEKAVRDNNDFIQGVRNNIYERQIGSDLVKPYDLRVSNQNFRMRDVPYELLWITPFPWDKLIKRELFLKVRFPEDIRFEDLACMLQLACMAENIGVVRKPLYNYRRTSGGFLSTLNEATLDIIKALEEVISFMEREGVLETYREEITFICARHIFLRFPAVLEKDNVSLKLKKRLVKEAYVFLDSHFPEWKGNHYLKYSGTDVIRKRRKLFSSKKKMTFCMFCANLLPRGVWNSCLNLARKTTKLFRSFKTASSKTKWLKKRKIFKLFKRPPAYKYNKEYLRCPVDKNIVFFESKHGEDIAGNVFNMIRELHRDEFAEMKIYLAVNEQTASKWRDLAERYRLSKVTLIEMFSRDYFKILASAGYLVTDTSLPPYYIKKEEQIYLNTWHGTPLKGMGRQVPEREFALGNIQRNFLIADWLLYQDEFSRDVFLDDYMLRNIYQGRIMLSGYPRNSALFHEETGDNIRKELGLTDKTVIAYMPTWRGVLHKKNFDEQITSIYQYLIEIDALLRDDQVFFVKLHPYVGDTINYDIFRHIRPFYSQYDTYDFLNITDMLVTDYSSIMFDYAVSGKKIILFAYDREKYLAERGIYIDLDTVEFPVVETVEDLVREFDRPNRGYPGFQKKFCPYDAPDTALEVCRTLLTGHETVKCESLPSDGLKNVLIYAGDIDSRTAFEKLIKDVNQLNLDEYHYYIAFKADKALKNTDVLHNLDLRAGYIPLQKGVNVTLMEYLARYLYLNQGWHNKWIEKKVKASCLKQLKRHFGNAAFSCVIYYNGDNSVDMRMLGYMSGRKVCNLTNFSLKLYNSSKRYQKFIKQVLHSADDYDMIFVNEEIDSLNIYHKNNTDRRCGIIKSEGKNINDLMEVQS